MGNLAEYYGGGVDAAPDEGAVDFELLPAGWYPVQIDGEEIKPTQKAGGLYLNVKFTVLGDNFANRKLFHKFNVRNASSKAVEISQRQLGAIALACGIQKLTDSKELLGKRLDIRVKVGKPRNGYPADNEVTAFEPLGSKSGGSAPERAPAQTYGHPGNTAPAPTPAAAPAAKGGMPWER